MNEIVNELLLAGDKFMTKMHLKQPRFTYSTCGSFTKNKKEFKNLCKQQRQIIFARLILTKHVLNIIWLMLNIKI